MSSLYTLIYPHLKALDVEHKRGVKCTLEWYCHRNVENKCCGLV